MSYINPLHPIVSNNHCSGYSALNGAVPRQASCSHRKRLPQPPYTPASKWHNSTGRTNAVHPSVTFDYQGYNRQGVSMRDLCTRSVPGLCAMIAGGDDRVLAHTGLQRITLRILWPGYNVEWARSLEVATADGPVTRARLGQLIAQNFSRFIEMHRSSKCSAPEFMIAPNNIRFDHLYLVALNNVFEDSWQADVILDLR